MIKELLNEIANGYDDLIRKIQFNAFNEALVVISAIKYPENIWINKEFKLDNLTEFCVKKIYNTYNEFLPYNIKYI